MIDTILDVTITSAVVLLVFFIFNLVHENILTKTIMTLGIISTTLCVSFWIWLGVLRLFEYMFEFSMSENKEVVACVLCAIAFSLLKSIFNRK